MKEDMPIVFVVSRFLYSGMELAKTLTPNECRLLLFLADCYGSKGIIPGIETISHALNISHKTIQRTTRLLEEKNLLIVDYKQGLSNAYGLVIPCPCQQEEARKLSTTPVNYDRTKLSTTPVICDCRVRSSETQGAVNSDRLYILDPLDDKPRESVREKKPRSRSSLSDFVPVQENIELARRLNVNLEVELKSFKDRYSGKGRDLQADFERWIKQAADYAQKKKGNVISRQHMGAAYQEFVPPPKVTNAVTMPNDLKEMMSKIKRTNV